MYFTCYFASILFILQVPGIEIHNVDIADWDRTRVVVESIGPIDLLINNAGITNWSSFLDVTKDELEKYACFRYTIFIPNLGPALICLDFIIIIFIRNIASDGEIITHNLAPFSL